MYRVCRRGRKHCNCHEVRTRLHGRKSIMGKGAIHGLVGRLNLGYRIEVGGCHSCGKRINGLTPGLLRQGFCTRTPCAGLIASIARFSLFNEGLCLSPVLSLCGNRLVDCAVCRHPMLSVIVSVVGGTLSIVNGGDGTVLRSSRN